MGLSVGFSFGCYYLSKAEKNKVRWRDDWSERWMGGEVNGF